MSVDRILQLKLVTDVGDISRKMGQVDSSVGRVRGAFRGLRGFVGPVVIDAALTGLGLLADGLVAGMADVRDYDKAVFGLGRRLRGSFSAEETERIAGDLTAIGTALGFGDDAALVRGLEKATGQLGSLEKAQRAVGLAMDVSRAKGIPFAAALDLVLKGGDGSAKAMKALGIEGDTARGRWADMEETFGGSAEAFVETADGAREVAEAMGGDVWETLGGAANDAIDELTPKLLDLWTQWQPTLTEIAEKAGPVFDTFAGILQRIADIFVALVPIITAAWDAMSPFVDFMAETAQRVLEGIDEALGAIAKALKGDFAGAWEGIKGVVRNAINYIIGLWNTLGDALQFNFDLPRFDIPDPTQLLEGGTITIGGGHVSSGRLLPFVTPLASGGIVTGPTLAMVGEAGPEAVIPLGRGGMGNTYNISLGVVTDPAAAGRAIVEAIQQYERRAGAMWRS